MKVLLISPLDPEIPSNLKYLMGGESTYTKTLLENPPAGVEFIHFEKALSLKLIQYSVWQRILSMLMKLRILPVSAGFQCFKIDYDFNLIHLHAYSGKFSGKKIPIVLGDSSSNILFLKDYLNWPKARIRTQIWIKQFIFRLFRVYDPDVNIMDSKKLIVFSKFSKKFHISQGIPKEKIEVIYPGIPKRNLDKKSAIKGYKAINILFAGVWFERKGGRILLQAFEVLSKKYKNIKLTILGPVPQDLKVKNTKIIQKDFVSYSELIKKYYPSADIFVLVPPKAEGFGMVTLEAMSFGIPVIVSDIYALPELIQDKKTGLIVKGGNVESLTSALEKLITDSKLRNKIKINAGVEFKKRFLIEIRNKKLLILYSKYKKS